MIGSVSTNALLLLLNFSHNNIRARPWGSVVDATVYNPYCLCFRFKQCSSGNNWRGRRTHKNENFHQSSLQYSNQYGLLSVYLIVPFGFQSAVEWATARAIYLQQNVGRATNVPSGYSLPKPCLFCSQPAWKTCAVQSAVQPTSVEIVC